MNWVRQEHRTGCGYATMAMLTDQLYEKVLADFYVGKRRHPSKFPRLLHGAELARYVMSHGWRAINHGCVYRAPPGPESDFSVRQDTCSSTSSGWMALRPRGARGGAQQGSRFWWCGWCGCRALRGMRGLGGSWSVWSWPCGRGRCSAGCCFRWCCRLVPCGGRCGFGSHAGDVLVEAVAGELLAQSGHRVFVHVRSSL